MSPRHNKHHRRTSRRRAGLTLAEMLMAITILSMVGMAVAAISTALQASNVYIEGNHSTVQQARVTLDRIRRSVEGAYANDQFPGFAVFSESHGSWEFPDTLVVWQPSGDPTNPDGLPTMNELAFFTPDPSSPNQLLEITVPDDTGDAADLSDTVAWTTDLAAIRADESAVRIVLTELLRNTQLKDEDLASLVNRGSIRFQQTLHPTAAEWTSYQAGDTDFEDLSWAQDIHGHSAGLRQARLSIEMQLVPDYDGGTTDTDTLPFFGSAALYYDLEK